MRQRLEAIYREHRQGLLTLALAITRSATLAEDAVHDAVLRLWRSARQPQGDAVAYVFASVRNAAIEVRRRQRPQSLLRDSLFAARDDATCTLEAAEEGDRVRRAIDGLPLRARQVVVMRVYGELTFQQIAETLDEPLQTVASRYRRALEQIRQQLSTADEHT